MKHVGLNKLQKASTGVPVFGGVDFETPWEMLDYVELAPGEHFSPPLQASCEEGYVVLDGALECSWAVTAEQLEGPAVLLCGAGARHTLSNSGERPARLLYVKVAMEESAAGAQPLRAEAVDAGKLRWRAAIHGGAGRIATRHIWGPDDFCSTWTFLDHAVLEKHSSVGYHYHDALEECFLILRGRGYMTLADESFDVGPGSMTWQGIGQGHGIYNPHAEELDFLRLAVAQRDEDYTTVDLHDSLAARRP